MGLCTSVKYANKKKFRTCGRPEVMKPIIIKIILCSYQRQNTNLHNDPGLNYIVYLLHLFKKYIYYSFLTFLIKTKTAKCKVSFE